MKERQSKESRETQSALRSTNKRRNDDIRSDAWERFERAVDIAARTKPMPKPVKRRKRAR